MHLCRAPGFFLLKGLFNQFKAQSRELCVCTDTLVHRLVLAQDFDLVIGQELPRT